MSETLRRGEVMLDTKHFRDDRHKIIEVINRIRGKGGEAYDEEGGHRNPVKADTAPLLQMFAAQEKPKRVFEMGTAYGFSTLFLGLGHPAAYIDTVEFDQEVAQEAQTNLGMAGIASHVWAGTVAEVLATFGSTDVRYDLVFIDHKKSLYLPDFQSLEPYLSPGAVVLADNVNDRRAECEPFVDYMLKQYNDVEILATEAGLLVARA